MHASWAQGIKEAVDHQAVEIIDWSWCNSTAARNVDSPLPRRAVNFGTTGSQPLRGQQPSALNGHQLAFGHRGRIGRTVNAVSTCSSNVPTLTNLLPSVITSVVHGSAAPVAQCRSAIYIEWNRQSVPARHPETRPRRTRPQCLSRVAQSTRIKKAITCIRASQQ